MDATAGITCVRACVRGLSALLYLSTDWVSYTLLFRTVVVGTARPAFLLLFPLGCG